MHLARYWLLGANSMASNGVPRHAGVPSRRFGLKAFMGTWNIMWPGGISMGEARLGWATKIHLEHGMYIDSGVSQTLESMCRSGMLVGMDSKSCGRGKSIWLSLSITRVYMALQGIIRLADIVIRYCNFT